MTPGQALVTFVLAAGVLTLTPGLDTMLVVRTAVADGRRAATLAALGISTGVLGWGALVAAGLGVLLRASPVAYAALTYVGAAYLVATGVRMITRPRGTLEGAGPAAGRDAPFRRGLLTNLLNPKVGVFYVSFLPQFVPTGWPLAPTVLGLAALHAGMGTAWLAGLAAGSGRLAATLRSGPVVGVLDQLTGGVFVAFGLRLALNRMP